MLDPSQNEHINKEVILKNTKVMEKVVEEFKWERNNFVKEISMFRYYDPKLVSDYGT
jgi:hypothetical protein